MAQVIPVMMLAGTAVSAVGAISQANAQQASHEYNARLNERSAVIAHQQANAEVEQIRRQSEKVQGTLQASFGASGLTDGNAVDVLAESASQAQLDIETVKYRSNLKVMGYHDSATLDRMAGKTSEEQGYLRSASEVLTGVGRAGASYAAGARRIGGTNSYVY